MRPPLRLPYLLVMASLVFTPACDLEEGGALVHVFSTHHATPEDGLFPDRGAPEKPRIFENDLGWTVVLLESYITTVGMTLFRCDGTAIELNMFWGPCPEDLRLKDLERFTVAGLKASAGYYCALEVTYGPYELPEDEEGDELLRHQIPEDTAMLGATIYLRGAARMGDGDSIPFDLRYTNELPVLIDLRDFDGDGIPLRVNAKENFPRELTVSKTYDRFFDGVDFENFDERSLEAKLGGVLRAETRVSRGALVTNGN